MNGYQAKPDAFAFAERLHTALDRITGVPAREKRGRGAWLARVFGIANPTANGWLNGQFMPTPERARVIAERAGLAFDWLYFGRGEPESDGAESTPGVNDTSKVMGEKFSPTPPSLAVRSGVMRMAVRLADEVGDDLTSDERAELIVALCDVLAHDVPDDQARFVARASAGLIERLRTAGHASDAGSDNGGH